LSACSAALLRKTSLFKDKDDSAAEQALKDEAWDLNDAERVLKLIQNARRTGTAMKDRVEAFRDMAKKDGFKLRAVVAFALVAGQDDVHVGYTLTDSNWMNINLSRGEAKDLPAQP
jgi:hypothetical protein